jgi:Short repeat of unknown function (DUF308)
MTNALFPDNFFRGRVEAASRWLFWVGLAMVALGIAAIVFPMASTLVATLTVGWMFLFFGIIALLGSFHGTGPFFGAMLVALLAIAAGLFLLLHAAAGAAILTLIVGLLFSVQGAFEISLRVRNASVYGMGRHACFRHHQRCRGSPDRSHLAGHFVGSSRYPVRHQLPQHRHCRHAGVPRVERADPGVRRVGSKNHLDFAKEDAIDRQRAVVNKSRSLTRACSASGQARVLSQISVGVRRRG